MVLDDLPIRGRPSDYRHPRTDLIDRSARAARARHLSGELVDAGAGGAAAQIRHASREPAPARGPHGAGAARAIWLRAAQPDGRRYPSAIRFDLIFCRNVLIYFDKPTQRKVVTQLVRLPEAAAAICSSAIRNRSPARPAAGQVANTVFRS
jgi:chemotaxis protein methyltransferase CheR